MSSTTKRGWDIFYCFYRNRDKPTPVLNCWNMALARFVVPNVFLEPLLIRKLGKQYHPTSMTVRTTTQHIFVDIARDVIIQYFDLNISALNPIDLKRLEVEYSIKKYFLEEEKRSPTIEKGCTRWGRIIF